MCKFRKIQANNKIQKNSEKFRNATGRVRQHAERNLEVLWPAPANFRKTSEMRPVGSGKTHTNSEMRRPVPAKVREIHSTCPGVFQNDRNLQQIQMRAMSVGLC